MMWSRGCSPYISKGDAEFSCSPGGTTIPTIIATTTPSAAATAEHAGYVGQVDLTLVTSSRQFLSPDVGPALHAHVHHHHHHHGVTSGTATGTSGLERVPSANRLQPQSSTETSGLGETVTSGFSSQESVHSAASYNFNPSASSTTIAATHPNEEDDDVIAHATTTSTPSATSTSRTGRYSNPSHQEARATDAWRAGIDRPHRLAWNDTNGQGGESIEGRAGGRGGGIVQRRQDARRTGHSSSGVGDYAASRSAVAQSEGREKEEKGRKKRAPEDRHTAGDCVRECDVGGGGGGGGGARGGGGSGGNSSGGGCGGKGEVTVAGEPKAGGGNFGERSRRCEIDRTLPRSGRLRDGAGGSEEKRGGRERTGSSCGNSPPDSGAPPFAAADRPRGRERDGAAARAEDRDHKVSARRNRDSSQGKSSAREKDAVTAGRSDGRLRAKEECQTTQDVQRQRDSRGRRDSSKKSGSGTVSEDCHTHDRPQQQQQQQQRSARPSRCSDQTQNSTSKPVGLDNERRRERNLEKPKSRDSDASSVPIDGQQARQVASYSNRILEKQPSRDSGRGRSPDVQTPEEAAAHLNDRRAKSASGNHRHAPARSPPPASSDIITREFDHLVTSTRGERTARGPQSSAAEDGGSGISALTERSRRDVKRESFDAAGDSSCRERFLSAASSRRGGESGSAAGGGREAAERGHVSRGPCRSRDTRVPLPLPLPPAAPEVDAAHQVSDGHIKGNPRRDSRSDSVRVVQASAEPVTSSQQLHQLQRGGAAHEDLPWQRNAGRDRKSVDKGKRSEASRQADDRGRSGAVADRGRHASDDTGPKFRQEGPSLKGSNRGSDPPPLTSSSDSPGRHTRLRDDWTAKVEGNAPGRSAGARELGSERRKISEEKSQSARVTNPGAELCDQKLIRAAEKDFIPDKASVSVVGPRASRNVPRDFPRGNAPISEIISDTSRGQGRHKQSDFSHGSKTKEDKASNIIRGDLLERAGGTVSRGAEQLDARFAPGHDDRPRSESSVQPPRSVIRRSDANSRNLRGSSERTADSSQLEAESKKSRRHVDTSGTLGGGQAVKKVSKSTSQTRDPQAEVSEGIALRSRLDGGCLSATGAFPASSMGADGRKPPADGKPPTTIVTVTSPTSPPDPDAVFHAHPNGSPNHQRLPERIPLYQRRLGHQDRMFDDLFSQAGGGRHRTGPGPAGGAASGRRSPSLVVTGPSGSPVQGLQVDQINQEWERRESRGSLRSNRSRSSHGGSFHSRSGSIRRHGSRFLAINPESAWSRWSRDRRASYRRRIELLDKPEQKLTRVSTPIRKARQEGLKFVHPDLEGTYLSEEDLNALRRHKQQKYHAIRVIEKNRKGKFRMKTKVHLTAEQWQVLGDFWEHPAFVRGRYVGLAFMFLTFLLMIVSITNSNWVTYEAFNLTVYEGLWVNCTKPLPSAVASGEMCKSTNGRGFSGGMWQSCYQNLSDPEAYSKCPEKRPHWQNAVIGLMIFAASFGVLASVLSICGVCTTPLPRKIYYFHSAGEIFLICALSTGVALMVFPIAIEIDRNISSHRYGIGYGLGWGGAFFFLAAAVCMSLDDLVRESSRTKCCRWCWKSKQNDRTELRQV